MKRLAAFTLLEMLIGMLISGLVVAAAFSAFRMVSMQHKRYSERSAALHQLIHFRHALGYDFFHADSVLTSDEQTIRVFGKREVAYHFTEQFVVRNDGQATDTFLIKNTVLHIDEHRSDWFASNYLIRDLRIDFDFGSGRLPFRLEKKYPAAIYLKHNFVQNDERN